MAAKFIAARVNIKPLLPEDVLGEKNRAAALQLMKRELLKRIKKKLTLQQEFSKRAKATAAKVLKVEIKQNSLQVTTKHPGLEWLVKGRSKRSMRWLKKARRPIPIITKQGKLIFRTPTAKSFRQGPQTGPNVGKKPGWVHPGKQPADFVERAKQEARAFMREKFAELFSKRKRKGK